MKSIIVIFGEDAVKYYEWTNQVPSDEFISLNGGQVMEVDFRTIEEHSAYLQALADFDSWSTYATIEKDIITEECTHCAEWKSFFSDKESKTYCPDCGELIIPKQPSENYQTKLQFRLKGQNEWRDFPVAPSVDNFNNDFPAEFMHRYYSSDYIAWEQDMFMWINDESTQEEFKAKGHDIPTKWQAEEEMKRLRQIIINETMADFFEDLVAGKVELRRVKITQ